MPRSDLFFLIRVIRVIRVKTKRSRPDQEASYGHEKKSLFENDRAVPAE
jgi:hypothetical protein